jgi:hypothetical protein
LPERLIVESRLPDFECVPFLSVDLLVYVDDIQMLVLWNSSMPESGLQAGLLRIPSKVHDNIHPQVPPSVESGLGSD